MKVFLLKRPDSREKQVHNSHSEPSGNQDVTDAERPDNPGDRVPDQAVGQEIQADVIPLEEHVLGTGQPFAGDGILWDRTGAQKGLGRDGHKSFVSDDGEEIQKDACSDHGDARTTEVEGDEDEKEDVRADHEGAAERFSVAEGALTAMTWAKAARSATTPSLMATFGK